MGDFTNETDMVNWGKQFVTKIFELCTNREIVCFKAQNPSNFNYQGASTKQAANDWEVTVETNTLIQADHLRKSTALS
jgi:hypothetical protein